MSSLKARAINAWGEGLAITLYGLQTRGIVLTVASYLISKVQRTQ